jgi:hypothetical protein
MSIVDKLMDSAAADLDVLRSLEAQGDEPGKVRDMDFLLRCPSKEKAELVAGFINDCRYGKAKAIEDDDSHSVQVIINMPVKENVILSVSGFMTCLAELYNLDFDGWGCVAQVRDN